MEKVFSNVILGLIEEIAESDLDKIVINERKRFKVRTFDL